jgi:SAM-dependent methyltransferase
MRRHLLTTLICPRCGDHPIRAAGAEDVIDEGWVECPQGHRLEVRRGVLHAMGELTPEIAGQLEENARERRGELSDDEKDAYRRNISRIGLATYNRLIRDNGRAALDAISIHGGRSLDLGGGSGWLAAELARRDFEAVSLDIEDPHERLKQIDGGAAGRDFELVTDVRDEPGREAIDYVVGDMEQLPFADGAFDLVTTSAALHHSADPVRTLRQAARVLRPGGVLLALNEPAKGLFRDESPILGGRGEAAGEHLYWARTYVGFFRAAGLEPRLHFPGWIDRVLRERDWAGVVYYRRLLPLAGWLWSVPIVRALARGPLLRPALDLFGLTLICEARKPA